MSMQLDELARIAGEMERYTQRAGLMAGPMHTLVIDLWGCHAELMKENEQATRIIEELQGVGFGDGEER
jgi:hypothetical protein